VILVDTSVLSLAFRRRARPGPELPLVRAFRRLVEEDQPVAIPAIVLQELLSGVKTEHDFARLDILDGFPIVPAARVHHVAAARISNACRQAGVSASAVDCLIAAMTVESKGKLLTADEDFSRIARHCDLQLFGT
jgi:predicted nucleic acid-binding protein